MLLLCWKTCAEPAFLPGACARVHHEPVGGSAGRGVPAPLGLVLGSPRESGGNAASHRGPQGGGFIIRVKFLERLDESSQTFTQTLGKADSYFLLLVFSP